jgi:glycine/D-amino acid oxidase-like deaminating enzyme
MDAVQPFSHDGLPIYNNQIQLQRLIFNQDDLNNWIHASIHTPNEVELLNGDGDWNGPNEVELLNGDGDWNGPNEVELLNGDGDWNGSKGSDGNSGVYDDKENKSIDESVIRSAIALIKGAVIVNPFRYLTALWKSIQFNNPNTQWFTKAITSLSDLSSSSLSSSYDIVVVACGPGILNLCPQLNKELRLVRGQNLFFDPSNNNSVDMNIGYLSGEYIIPHRNPIDNSFSLLCGATHEHITNEQYNAYLPPFISTAYNNDDISICINKNINCNTITINDNNNTINNTSFDINSSRYHHHHQCRQQPNIAVAEQLLKNKLNLMMPTIQNMKIISGNVGTRVVTTRSSIGRLPIIGKVPIQNRNSSSLNDSGSSTNVWMMTGFGSRGLVHHALLADYLCQSIINDDESIIPMFLRPKLK